MFCFICHKQYCSACAATRSSAVVRLASSSTAVGYAVGRRTIVVLCYAYIYTVVLSIFSDCVLFYHAFQVKTTQIHFDTHYPCISNCWARPRRLQKIVYAN